MSINNSEQLSLNTNSLSEVGDLKPLFNPIQEQEQVGENAYGVFESAKRRMLTAAGVLATSAVSLFTPALATAETTDPYYSPEKALKEVRNAVFPSEKRRGTIPTGAFLNQNTGSFSTDCSTSPFKNLVVDTGASFATLCAGEPVTRKFPDGKMPGAFKTQLNKLGNYTMRATTFDFKQSTQNFQGNRERYTIKYQCPTKQEDPYTGQEIQPAGIKRVTVDSERRAYIKAC